MSADIDLDLAADDGQPRPRHRRVWLTLVFLGLWAIVGFVTVPLLAYGLGGTGAIFGSGGFRTSTPYMWALTVGTGLLFLSVAIGLSLALAFRRWLSAAAFGILLAGAIIFYSAVYRAHPEWFEKVMRVVTS
ncbi:hypothetical protein [Allorhizocola rhizosphaerae]|uniref:hypothetical protein n=1 Tax=Allorhizocola rhizosphaerae TaxID=1872709 RepID=UPI000E3C1F98|nr:hypothetical protein [Allorhizocola rhizosphaerae]